MTRFLSLLFLCLFLAACQPAATPDCESTATAAEGDTQATNCTEPSNPDDGSEPIDGGTTTGGSTTGGGTEGGSLPDEAYKFDTNLIYYNTDPSDEIKLNKAVEIIKSVVATEEFRDRVINHTYNGKKTYVDNDGFTNAQIYQMILDGAEELQNTKDNQMDLEVELYYSSGSTVGYTYANNKRIWVNTKFFDSYTAAGVAANLFHEWLHKVGFGHASSYSTSRDYSVPYAIGDIVGELGKDYL